MNLHVFSSVCVCVYIYIVKIPDGYVRIRWDIMNETRGSYSANVTITDY